MRTASSDNADGPADERVARDAFRIRRLVPADAVEYRRVMLDAYERHPDAFTSSAAERAAVPASWWETRLSIEPDADEVVFGAFVADTLAGVAGLSFETRAKARHKATLFGMYVPDMFRQRGMGRALVTTALDYARRARNVRLVQLTVSEGNAAAEALYRQCGFVPFGLEPYAVALGSGFVAKIHMWCDLDGER